MAVEFDYSVGLALFDFIPVALSSIGLMLVANCIARLKPSLAKMCIFAVMLIIAGGVSKACWKLLIASADVNMMALNHLLFIFLAPGFTLLSWCLWAARREFSQRPLSRATLGLPIAAIAVFGATATYLAMQFPEDRFWFLSLLVLLTLSNTIFIWHAARLCWAQNLKPASLLFVLNFIGIIVMSGLARMGHQDEHFQWIEEIVNSVTQGCLLLGAWLLWRRTKADTARNS